MTIKYAELAWRLVFMSLVKLFYVYLPNKTVELCYLLTLGCYLFYIKSFYFGNQNRMSRMKLFTSHTSIYYLLYYYTIYKSQINVWLSCHFFYVLCLKAFSNRPTVTSQARQKVHPKLCHRKPTVTLQAVRGCHIVAFCADSSFL